MAELSIQSRRKRLAGVLRFGAGATNGATEWQRFDLTLCIDADAKTNRLYDMHTLSLDRVEAQKVVDALSGYLAKGPRS